MNTSLCNITRLLLLLVVATGLSFNTSAQDKQPAFRVKCAMMLRMLEYTQWPQQNQLQQINLAYIGDDSNILTELQQISSAIKVGQLPFTIKKVTLEQLDPQNYQAVFLHQSKSDKISALANKTRRTNTLLISDKAPSRHDVMINFLEIEQKLVDFELNRSNIVFEKLQVDRDLFLLGGSEIDVAELFRETEASLQQIKQQLFDNRQALLNKQQLLEKTSASLEQKQQQIDNFKQELNQQQQQLQQRAAALDKLNQDVNLASNTLKQKQQQLQQQEQHNQELAKNLRDQEVKVAYLNEQIDEKQAFLATQQQQLNTLQGRNNQQQGTIDTHERTIIGGVITVAILILLILYIFRIYLSRRRSNELLRQAQANLVSLGAIGRDLTANLELNALLTQIYNSLSKVINPNTLMLGIVDQQRIKVTLHYQNNQAQAEHYLDLTTNNEPLVWCVNKRKELVCNDLQQYSNYFGQLDSQTDTKQPMATIICQPLIVGQQVVGCLSLQSPNSNAFTDLQIGMIRTLSRYIAIALANALGFEQLQQQKKLTEAQNLQIANAKEQIKNLSTENQEPRTIKHV